MCTRLVGAVEIHGGLQPIGKTLDRGHREVAPGAPALYDDTVGVDITLGGEVIDTGDQVVDVAAAPVAEVQPFELAARFPGFLELAGRARRSPSKQNTE